MLRHIGAGGREQHHKRQDWSTTREEMHEHVQWVSANGDGSSWGRVKQVRRTHKTGALAGSNAGAAVLPITAGQC